MQRSWHWWSFETVYPIIAKTHNLPPILQTVCATRENGNNDLECILERLIKLCLEHKNKVMYVYWGWGWSYAYIIVSHAPFKNLDFVFLKINASTHRIMDFSVTLQPNKFWILSQSSIFIDWWLSLGYRQRKGVGRFQG